MYSFLEDPSVNLLSGSTIAIVVIIPTLFIMSVAGVFIFACWTVHRHKNKKQKSKGKGATELR